MPLSAIELQRLRDAHAATFNATCDIYRKSKSTNVYGGAADTWVLHLADVPCRVMPERDRRLQEVAAERETTINYYRLTVAYNTDLRTDDQIIFEGETYQMVALWDNHDLRTVRRAVLAKVS